MMSIITKNPHKNNEVKTVKLNRRQRKKAKKLFRHAISSFIFLSMRVAMADPAGEQIVAGSGAITHSGTTTTIQQNSQNLSVNWTSFNVAPQEIVNFNQPSNTAIAVNRIADINGSKIEGHLNANGQVYLINPNGVIFSKDSQVNVGGLVASTLDVKDADLNNSVRNFSGDGAGAVINQGSISTTAGGAIALIANHVSNEGSITSPQGIVAFGAGKSVNLTFAGNSLVDMQVDQSAVNNLVENKQLIQANNGLIMMTAGAKNSLMASVVNNTGVVEAKGLSTQGGVIKLEGDVVYHTGSLDASGAIGGHVDINARAILDTGTVKANGNVGQGGSIQYTAREAIEQTISANTQANGVTTGGSIQLDSDNTLFSSGTLSTTGQQGGSIDTLGNNITLVAATLNASGAGRGGAVRVGGDFHGANTTVKNAQKTIVNGATKIKANGGNGRVVVWSDKETDYYGNISAKQGGNIEVSSHGFLNYAGIADAGLGGKLLLDPANIVISSDGGSAAYSILDPHAAAGNSFGKSTAILGTTINGVFTESGKIAVTSPYDSLIATSSGAAYLFDKKTGGLISTLTGSQTNDRVGLNGVTALANGNFVVDSSTWANGPYGYGGQNAGAVTWVNGQTGLNGSVSVANSFVGPSRDQNIGTGGITALTNGNYVISSPNSSIGVWLGGSVTFGNGSIGSVGIISSSNSLIGLNTYDYVGNGGITALSNGNYVINSPVWQNPAVTAGYGGLYAGAVTWADGTTGISGTISSANSVVGDSYNMQVGSGGVTALHNGNYLISSNQLFDWAGGVTWVNGSSSFTGNASAVITTANSLTGSYAYDFVGVGGVTVLPDGNYVVESPNWGSNRGAVTWGNGATGIFGVVSSNNSLIGSQSNDYVGKGGVIALSNGNYVVLSPYWANGSLGNAGAVTWINGFTGTSGFVATTNSLVGDQANDFVGIGGVTALTNGNYVVDSYNWINGAITNAGAVTWANGSTGMTGVVSTSNSLFGTGMNDQVGFGGVTSLYNGNYVIDSSNWSNGSLTGAGAVTWVNGTTGTSGTFSLNNSLIGSHSGDNLGSGGIKALANGDYLVASPNYASGSGQVLIGTPGNILFSDGFGQTMTFDPSALTDTLASGTSVTMQASNDITVNAGISVGGSTGGALTLQAGREINLNAGIITANGNFTAIAGDAGAIAADKQAGTPTINLGLGASINAGTGTVILAANGGNFVNNSGSVSPISAGRWLIYSSTPALDVLGGMTVTNKHYAQVYTGTTPAYASSGNWNFYSAAPVLSVTPDFQLFNYGFNPSLTQTYTGFIGGDTSFTAGINGAASFNVGGSKSTSGNYVVGQHDVSYVNGLSSSLGYTFADNSASVNELTVTPKTINISGIAADNKVYDDTVASTINTSGLQLAGLVSGDNLTLTSAGVFSDKNAGIGKTVNLTNSYGGLDVSNYVINDQLSTLADITPKSLVVNGITALNKIYDGSVSAVINTTGLNLSGLVAGDNISVNSIGVFSDKNVGIGKTVTLANAYSGADVNNYAITDQVATLASITQKALTVSGLVANNRVYDGTVADTISTSGAVYTGLVAGDAISVSATGSFSDKKVGSGKSVTLTSAYAGADVGNYSITGQSASTASITPKTLMVSGLQAGNKVYDGTTSAMVNTSMAVLNGLIASDNLTVSSVGAFGNKNVGTGKGVSLTNIYGGSDVGNYTIIDQLSALANITPKSLAVSGIHAQNKVYDGSTSVSIDTSTVAMQGLVSGDSLNVYSTGQFSDSNVGVGKTVNLMNHYVGADFGNYQVVDQKTVLADIVANSPVASILESLSLAPNQTPASINNLSTQLNSDSVMSPSNMLANQVNALQSLRVIYQSDTKTEDNQKARSKFNYDSEGGVFSGDNHPTLTIYEH